MPSHDAFLKEIVANPEDLTPRLVYADWLDEQGDPRGEFIRVQCELASLDETDDRYPDLLFRERELLAEHRVEWLRPLKPYIRSGTFRCGFVERAKFRFRGFIHEAERVSRIIPLRSVVLTAAGIGKLLPDLAGLPILSQLKGLDLPELRNCDDFVNVIASCPPEFQLHRLGFFYWDFPHRQLQRLFCLPTVRQVRQLKFSRCDFSMPAFDAVTESGLPLTQLDLSGCMLFHDYVKGLASSQAFARLESLHLALCGIGNSGLEAILKSEHLRGLKHIDLTGNPFERGAGAILIENMRWENLISFGLVDYRFALSIDELSALLMLPGFQTLRRLSLSLHHENWKAIETLASWPGLARLTHLGLRNPHGTLIEGRVQLRPLFESPFWTGRTLLCLNRWSHRECIRWLRQSGLSEWEKSVTFSEVPIGNLHDPIDEHSR